MTQRSLYPLTFVPIFKERVWGGDRLATVLGKALPQGHPVGESWELADLASDQSRVETGPLRGRSLGDVVGEHGEELMGPVRLDGGSFPLLVKMIDAQSILSVQVHPDADAAAKLGGRAKSEAWYILDAESEAVIYWGLKPGTLRGDFEKALGAGRVEHLLQAVPVRRGDLFPVPPGTVHAIGAGILLAEIQQPSDTTFRVYDWGRLGLDGQPRTLHIAQALESIHFDEKPAIPRTGREIDLGVFRFEVQSLKVGETLHLASDGPHVVVGLEGEVLVRVDACDGVPCARGKVVLVPHGCRPACLTAVTPARVLSVAFPI